VHLDTSGVPSEPIQMSSHSQTDRYDIRLNLSRYQINTADRPVESIGTFASTTSVSSPMDNIFLVLTVTFKMLELPVVDSDLLE
jgi:hypothetical protein